LSKDGKTLCAIHRGDSFINNNQSTENPRTMIYQWNVFGFSEKTYSAADADSKRLYAFTK